MGRVEAGDVMPMKIRRAEKKHINCEWCGRSVKSGSNICIKCYRDMVKKGER